MTSLNIITKKIFEIVFRDGKNSITLRKHTDFDLRAQGFYVYILIITRGRSSESSLEIWKNLWHAGWVQIKSIIAFIYWGRSSN